MRRFRAPLLPFYLHKYCTLFGYATSDLRTKSVLLLAFFDGSGHMGCQICVDTLTVQNDWRHEIPFSASHFILRQLYLPAVLCNFLIIYGELCCELGRRVL